METIELRFSGFGGQGLIMASVVLAEAASMYESKYVVQKDDQYKREESGLFVVQTQTYGSGVRGGATRAEVKISTKEVHYPEVRRPDVLVLMSEEAFHRFSQEVKPSTLMIIDPDTVKSRPDREYCEIRATVTASEMGNKIVANMVMLGAVVAMTNVVHLDSLKKAVKDLFPPSTHELNSKALEKGHQLGLDCGSRLEVDWG